MITKSSTFLFALLIAMLTSQLLWGANGRIEGKVSDATTGESLFGANIILEGTSIGAATNIDGAYLISNVPAGSYSLKVSYIGYEPDTVKVKLKEGEHLEINIKLQVVTVSTSEVVVTAQASGQNAAINQQLSSNNITNVVSSARIQELPDANAAESVGRLPGISLIRSGGEATQVVIRGLQPKYNMITINGVEIPPTSASDRGTDLSMVSSNMLSGIEVSKTVTPDMDAAVLGGTVNFDIKSAKATLNGTPSISLLAQGGFNGLTSSYNNYKYVLGIENRFFDNRFGIFAQAIVERSNHTSDELAGSYEIPDKKNHPNDLLLDNMTLTFFPRDQKRLDGTIVFDYKLPDGQISFTNLFTRGNTYSEYHNQYYNLAGNEIEYEAQYSPYTLNVVSNILSYEQRLFSIKVNAKLSSAYSDNSSPDNWWMAFDQLSTLSSIQRNSSPTSIANAVASKVDFNQMTFRYNSTWDLFNKQRNFAGTIDLERDVNISDLLNITFKAGGAYKYTDRYYDYDGGSGNIFGAFGATNQVRANIIKQFPWMTQPPYNLNPSGTDELPITMFLSQGIKFGTFLNGNYLMNSATDIGMISQVMNVITDYGRNVKSAPTGGVNPYIPDVFGSIASDYTGLERRNAGYIMATVNIGHQITIIPGVRYQGLQTSYTAAHFLNASATNPYPNTLKHTDSTTVEYHGFWLPDISLKYNPFAWLSARLSYTNTINYPDYNYITPVLDVYSSSVTYNNYALKPANSQNYDFQLSFFDNSIGLLSVDGFLKRIDNLIFAQSSYITDPSKFPGIPSYTKGYAISTYINNPNRVDDWGIESEWQTHFWYLPYPFNGLVLNVNYTHIFSSAKYPYTYVAQGGPPFFKSIYVDTNYTDRLYQQPNDIINLSLGYDINKFSIRVSMMYQSNVFNSTNFYNSLRSDKAKYLRWDLSAKQGLPWFGIEAFLDINNINGENDVYAIRGSGYPTSTSDYGLTADLGLRWKLE